MSVGRLIYRLIAAEQEEDNQVAHQKLPARWRWYRKGCDYQEEEENYDTITVDRKSSCPGHIL